MQTAISYLDSLTRSLEASPSLYPSPQVNHYFSSLVSYVTSAPRPVYDTMMRSETFTNLSKRTQAVCAKGESLLEYHWVDTFLSVDKLTYDHLHTFPYMHNYETLTALEVRTLRQMRGEASFVTFLGGGPLPLTAIIMASIYGYQMTVIDLDEEAVHRSRTLVEKLGLSENITIQVADAFIYVPTTPLTILGALVGDTVEEKAELLEHLARILQKDSFVFARSVTGIGELLYPKVPSIPCLTHIDTVRGPLEIINSIEVFKVPS